MSEHQPIRTMKYGEMCVEVYENRQIMGKAAAEACAEILRDLLAKQEEVNMLFPCAFSYKDFYPAFFAQKDVYWERVNAFVMDEYLGLPEGSPYALSLFAKEHIFVVPFKHAYTMNAFNENFDTEASHYAELLTQHPLDIACLGIGETGHLAYNDPAVANFNDPQMVKWVEIDPRSHEQAVHDGAFPTAESVPQFALTVTMPVMMRVPYKVVVVPTGYKKEAIKRTLTEEISTACPATILRNYQCTLYTDSEGAALL